MQKGQQGLFRQRYFVEGREQWAGADWRRPFLLFLKFILFIWLCQVLVAAREIFVSVCRI